MSNITYQDATSHKSLSASAYFRGDSAIYCDDTSTLFNFSDKFTIQLSVKLERFSNINSILFSGTRDTGITGAPITVQGGLTPDTNDSTKAHVFFKYTTQSGTVITNTTTDSPVDIDTDRKSVV